MNEKSTIHKKHVSNMIPFFLKNDKAYSYVYVCMYICINLYINICAYICMEKTYGRVHTKSFACIT